MKIHALIAAVLFNLAAVAQAAPFGWGLNHVGQLADGTTTTATTPVAVISTGVLAGKTLTSVATGFRHTIALADDGTLYAWGINTYGQLGDGTTTTATAPVAVDMTGVLAGKTILSIAAGDDYSLVVADDGKIYAWGANHAGQLGDGTTTNSSTPLAVDMSGVLSGKTATIIAAGQQTSMVITSTGKLYSWGANSYGQLGNGSTTSSSTPVAVDTSGVLSGKQIAAVDVHWHALAAATDGTLYSWGQNSLGQLGDGTTTNRHSPVAVTASGALSGKNITSVAAGNYHSLVLSDTGVSYGWGYNGYGQVGDGTTINRTAPVAVDTSTGLSGKVIIEVRTYDYGCISLADDGTLWTWGSSVHGEIGDGALTDRSSPTAVVTAGALAGKTATAISAGSDCLFCLAAPSTSTITPACRFSYAANFGWQNWRWSSVSPAAPAIESAILHGSVYSSNVGWIDLGDGTPTSGIRYSQTGQDYGVNHDGAGALVGYAYGANIGWIRFAQTWNSPPRVNLTTGALSGYAYSANCGWIHLGSLKTRISSGPDTEVLAGGGTGDGIADSWELERLAAAGLGSNLSLLGSSPTSDYDHDGISDHDEFLADTNPFSASNRLNVTGLTYNPQTGHIDLNWTGSDRRAFSVYSSSDLLNWSPVGTAQTGSTAALTLGGASVTKLFFRVGAALPLTP